MLIFFYKIVTRFVCNIARARILYKHLLLVRLWLKFFFHIWEKMYHMGVILVNWKTVMLLLVYSARNWDEMWVGTLSCCHKIFSIIIVIFFGLFFANTCWMRLGSDIKFHQKVWSRWIHFQLITFYEIWLGPQFLLTKGWKITCYINIFTRLSLFEKRNIFYKLLKKTNVIIPSVRIHFSLQ